MPVVAPASTMDVCGGARCVDVSDGRNSSLANIAAAQHIEEPLLVAEDLEEQLAVRP